jgi:hypothetical protein
MPTARTLGLLIGTANDPNAKQEISTEIQPNSHFSILDQTSSGGRKRPRITTDVKYAEVEVKGKGCSDDTHGMMHDDR